MIPRSVIHSTFTLTRALPVPPERVWQAYADPAQKRKWFVDSGNSTTAEYDLDFREGGSEVWRGTFDGSPQILMRASYIDLLENQRLVVAYQMHIGEQRISVSTQTTEFIPTAKGTELKLTEYGAYLDGLDGPDLRKGGTEWLLDTLAAMLGEQG